MESAGSRLKKIRLEKGVSLEEVQKKTKVKLSILRAIEGDGLTDLNPVYLRGFVKIYCQFLGVDWKDYLPDYKLSQPLGREKAFSQAKQVVAKDASVSFFKRTALNSATLKPNRKIKKTIIIFSAIVILLLLLFQLGRFVSSRRNLRAVKESTKSSKVEPKAKLKTVASKSTAAAAVAKPKEAVQQKKEVVTGIKLIIRAKEKCWISLKADGQLVFQSVLGKGRFETWKAKEKFNLSVANAGAVELEVNNRPFLNLGRRGQALKNIVITKDGLTIK